MEINSYKYRNVLSDFFLTQKPCNREGSGGAIQAPQLAENAKCMRSTLKVVVTVTRGTGYDDST